MKYLSLFVLLLMMSTSWSFVNHRPEISEDVHVGIQDDLKRIITEYIQNNLPSAQNIRFEKMWTEKLKSSQVKASFIYSFEDASEDVGEARVLIDGYAIINREPAQQQDEIEYWSFDELYILNNHVQFKDGITITPEKSE